MATLWSFDAKKRAEFSWDWDMWVGKPSFVFSMWIETQHAIEGGVSRDAACNLDLLVDSMMMSFDALLGSRLQGHECKRKTALLLAFTPLPFLFCLLYHPWPTLRTVYSCIHRQHTFWEEWKTKEDKIQNKTTKKERRPQDANNKTT